MPLIKPDETVPPELAARLDHYHKLLWLERWRIDVEVVDQTPEQSDATAYVTDAYWIGKIVVCRGVLKHPDVLDNLAIHELLHFVMTGQDTAARQVIGMLPPSRQDAARDVWDHADEKAIEWLARILVSVLPAPVLDVAGS